MGSVVLRTMEMSKVLYLYLFFDRFPSYGSLLPTSSFWLKIVRMNRVVGGWGELKLKRILRGEASGIRILVYCRFLSYIYILFCSAFWRRFSKNEGGKNMMKLYFIRLSNQNLFRTVFFFRVEKRTNGWM